MTLKCPRCAHLSAYAIPVAAFAGARSDAVGATHVEMRHDLVQCPTCKAISKLVEWSDGKNGR